MTAPADPLSFLGRGWAFPVAPNGTEAGADVVMAEHAEDVRQAILLVLGTRKGERAMRPDFGCGLQELVFEPAGTTTTTLARHHVEEALVTWEPRIDSITVDVTTRPGEPGTLLVDIRYRVRSTNTFYNLVYPFFLQEGAA